MTDSLLLTACLVVSTLTLITAIAAIIVMSRHIKPTDNTESPSDHFLPASPTVAGNVVTRLTFAESFDPERFALVSRDVALENINSTLASRAGDGVVMTINSVQLLRSGVEMTVSASRHGQQLLAEGTATIARHVQSGNPLPVLKDVQTGKIIEIMKGGKATLTRLASMSAAVIGAAHIISGADISHRLKLLDAKVDLLLAFRRMDQLAKMERIYTEARELLMGEMSHEKRWHLWRLRGELRELRCVWRRELEHHLKLIDGPNEDGWLARTFTFQSTYDTRIQSKITEGQLHLGLTEYSIRLDHVLAVGSDTLKEFEATLAAELSEFRRVGDLLESKAKMISGNDPNLSAEPTLKGMRAMIDQYAGLVGDDVPPVMRGSERASTNELE